MNFFKEILQKRDLLTTLAAREIRQQYVGSAMGILWQFVTPLVLILVFWVVFSVGFRVQPSSGVPFVVWLTAGMAAWFFFAEIVSGSVNSITGSPHLVKKVVFPIQALPIVKILTALSNHALFILILVMLMVWQSVSFSMWIAQFAYYLFCGIALALSISWLVASLNVFSRDVARLVGVLLQVGMWATPILWDIKMLPEPYKTLFSLNPVHYVVQGYRDSFLYATPFWQRPDETAIFWVITLVLMFTGIFVFRRLQPQFADLV
ncbi:MAG: ABC transporter permease [Pseudomonadota bacterium]